MQENDDEATQKQQHVQGGDDSSDTAPPDIAPASMATITGAPAPATADAANAANAVAVIEAAPDPGSAPTASTANGAYESATEYDPGSSPRSVPGSPSYELGAGEDTEGAWSCGICTLINHRSVRVCAICGEPATSEPAPSEQHREDTQPPPPPPPPPEAPIKRHAMRSRQQTRSKEETQAQEDRDAVQEVIAFHAAAGIDLPVPEAELQQAAIAFRQDPTTKDDVLSGQILLFLLPASGD